MWLYNPTGDWLSGEVEFVVGDAPSDVYGFTWPTLGEHRIKQYLDIVGEELNLSETRGYIVLTGADGGPAPQVAARTYNLDPAGGTYGLNLRAFGSDDLLYPGETGFVVGISNSADQNVGFRTNLGLLNTDRDRWTGVRLTLIDVTGAQVGEPMDMMIAPGVLRQFDVAKKFGVAERDGLRFAQDRGHRGWRCGRVRHRDRQPDPGLDLYSGATRSSWAPHGKRTAFLDTF